ncbi:MAG: ABC transporter permease [Propionibacteriaceae bacterium]|jgi:peptide/nickel transport system permease protein|nr:ABC transporter permease [Propionibacteriaceae bacterium]
MATASSLALRVAGRLGGILVVVWAATTLGFLVLRLIPGDPVDIIMTGITNATPELRAEIVHDLGLDRPFLVQYVSYLAAAAAGDLGTSYLRGVEVAPLIFSELGATVQYALTTVALAALIAIAIALFTSGRNRAARGLAQAFELTALSIPTFWSGLMLIVVFSFTLRLLPAFGAGSFAQLVLPVVTLALPLSGVISQVLRERMEHALKEPFVLSSRARGAGEFAVRFRHVARHGGLATLTLSSTILGAVLSGSAVLETLFARPGIGRILVTAVQDRDLPVVSGLIVVISALFAVINTAVDLLYPLIDPRLREARA